MEIFPHSVLFSIFMVYLSRLAVSCIVLLQHHHVVRASKRRVIKFGMSPHLIEFDNSDR